MPPPHVAAAAALSFSSPSDGPSDSPSERPSDLLLDDPAEWPSFGRPLQAPPDPAEAASSATRWESYLAIEGMHCAACTLAVESALQSVPGVCAVQVNGATATARIEWEPQASDQSRPSQWLAALRRAGYNAVPAGDLLDAPSRQREQRMLLWRWLVAGFGMMQTMMYAWPLYSAAPGDITADQTALLRWGAWMMTVPVLLFSCGPFFTGALRDLQRLRVGMDVPVALGLAIAFVASTAATFDPAGPWGAEVWYDSVTMFVFFLLSGRLLEARLRDRTAGALEALTRQLPSSVLRLDPATHTWMPIALRQLRVGDLLRVRPGEVIPADGRIEAGHSQVDEAWLTGESQALRRQAGDAVIAGSHNLQGLLTIRVERLGPDTRYAAIVALMARASVDKPHLARMADRIAAPFLLGVVLAAAGAAAWWWSAGPAHALAVAVSVLVVTCPCALSLATPAASLAAAGALARRAVLVRQLQSLEVGAVVDTVIFDKTGTLTLDAMAVVAVRCRPGLSAGEALASAAAFAAGSCHPAARALMLAQAHAQAHHGDQASGSEPAFEVPVAVDLCEHPGQGVAGRIDGQCLRVGSARFCGIDAEGGGSQVHLHDQGSQVHLADDAGWMASFELAESLRPDVLATLDRLRAMGLHLQLLSGDRPQAVARLAAQAGITQWQAACTPQDKLEAVRALQQQGHRVAMVGDGLNDGPVLARADLSVAMGEGVPLAQARADVVVQGAGLGPVADFIAHARRTQRVIRHNLAWAALYNLACVPLAVAGYMPAWLAGLGMAASSLWVVASSARLSRAVTRA